MYFVTLVDERHYQLAKKILCLSILNSQFSIFSQNSLFISYPMPDILALLAILARVVCEIVLNWATFTDTDKKRKS